MATLNGSINLKASFASVGGASVVPQVGQSYTGSQTVTNSGEAYPNLVTGTTTLASLGVPATIAALRIRRVDSGPGTLVIGTGINLGVGGELAIVNGDGLVGLTSTNFSLVSTGTVMLYLWWAI